LRYSHKNKTELTGARAISPLGWMLKGKAVKLKGGANLKSSSKKNFKSSKKGQTNAKSGKVKEIKLESETAPRFQDNNNNNNKKNSFTPPDLSREVLRSARKSFRIGCVTVPTTLQSRVTEILKGITINVTLSIF
jgi:hypothetical protein